MRFFASLRMTFAVTLIYSHPAFAARHEWTLDETYEGAHQETFQKLKYEVPIYLRQTVLDLSARLGFRYEEGWAYPLTVRFVDASPKGFSTENILAYVLLLSNGKDVMQQLCVNVEAYEKDPFNFRKVLAHELAHAMMNDQLGALAAETLPVWLHEGLAVYGADQGETMVRSYVLQSGRFDPDVFLNGLEGPHTALDYAEDYLAIKYIRTERGINSLHNFVREVVARRGDYKSALPYTCFEDWEAFQANAKKFSADEINEILRTRRDGFEKPY